MSDSGRDGRHDSHGGSRVERRVELRADVQHLRPHEGAQLVSSRPVQALRVEVSWPQARDQQILNLL